MKLKNGEIWSAYPRLLELSKVKLPVMASLKVAQLVNKLTQPYSVIEGERVKLVTQHGVRNEETKQTSVPPEKLMDYFKDWSELSETLYEDISFDKVKLPEKVAGTCDKCHHNMDVVFQIEPDILIPLIGSFIEVV